MQNNLNVSLKCEKCGVVFNISNSDVINHSEEFIDERGIKYWITSVDCTKCGKRHYVQIDNSYTRELKKSCIRDFALLSKSKLGNKNINKDKLIKFNKKRERLAKKRYELMKENDRKVMKHSTGYDVLINFTFC